MNTRTEHRPSVTDHHDSEQLPAAPQSRPETESPSPKTGLSPAQTLGGALAAATAAALGSRLGVVGTITGAALVSVIASLAGAVYTTSLRHTGRKVSTVLRTTRDGRPLSAGLRATTGPASNPAGLTSGLTARRVLVGAATVFALTAGGVTAFEAASGRSLDGDAGGTTVGRTVESTTGTTGGSGGSTEPATPTPSEVTTPSPSASEPSPSAETSEDSGTEETQTPSPTSTPSPTDTSTTDGTPSAEPTPSSTADPTDSTGDPGSEGGSDPFETGENPVTP
jgi:hypothetical protein